MDLQEAIKILTKKATAPHVPDGGAEAMKYSQAVLNLAHAASILKALDTQSPAQ